MSSTLVKVDGPLSMLTLAAFLVATSYAVCGVPVSTASIGSTAVILTFLTLVYVATETIHQTIVPRLLARFSLRASAGCTA